MIESIYGTPITAEADGKDVYLDINGMHDVLLTPETALRLAGKLITVAMSLSVAASDTEESAEAIGVKDPEVYVYERPNFGELYDDNTNWRVL